MLPSQVFVSEVGCRGEQVGVPQEERIAEQISVIAQALKDNGFQLKALSLFAEEATDGLWSLNDASLPGKLSG
jgi:hypothetical protein